MILMMKKQRMWKKRRNSRRKTHLLPHSLCLLYFPALVSTIFMVAYIFPLSNIIVCDYHYFLLVHSDIFCFPQPSTVVILIRIFSYIVAAIIINMVVLQIIYQAVKIFFVLLIVQDDVPWDSLKNWPFFISSCLYSLPSSSALVIISSIIGNYVHIKSFILRPFLRDIK